MLFGYSHASLIHAFIPPIYFQGNNMIRISNYICTKHLLVICVVWTCFDDNQFLFWNWLLFVLLHHIHLFLTTVCIVFEFWSVPWDVWLPDTYFYHNIIFTVKFLREDNLCKLRKYIWTSACWPFLLPATVSLHSVMFQ